MLLKRLLSLKFFFFLCLRKLRIYWLQIFLSKLLYHAVRKRIRILKFSILERSKFVNLANSVLLCFYWLYYILHFPWDPSIRFANSNCCQLSACIFEENLVRETDLNLYACLGGMRNFCPNLSHWSLVT